MYFRSLAVLALGSLALGQTAPSSPSSTPARLSNGAIGQRPSRSAPEATTSAVSPNDPVITIRGLCDTPSGSKETGSASKTAKPPATKTPADCKTVITRAQFEILANALQPEMAPGMKKKLAELYPTMIIMSHTAQERGYEKSPQFKRLMEFSRLQVLSMQLNRAVQKEAENVAPADIEKYYKDNSAIFEQVSLQRIFVPKAKGPQHANDKASAAATTEANNSEDDSAKKEAEILQTRAAAGEDFDKLQKEAFEFAGVTTPASNTNIRITANQLPATERAVLDLKPGEVSHALAENNGYFICKFLGKEEKPLDQVRDEIKSKLSQKRFQDTMDELHKSFETTLSEAYFGSEPAQASDPNRRMPVQRPLPPGGVVPVAAPTAGAAPATPAVVVTSPAAPKVQVPESSSAKPATPQTVEPPE